MIDYVKNWLMNLGQSTHFDQGSKPENHSSNISGVVEAIIELGIQAEQQRQAQEEAARQAALRSLLLCQKYLIGHADVIVPLVEDIVALVAKHKG